MPIDTRAVLRRVRRPARTAKAGIPPNPLISVVEFALLVGAVILAGAVLGLTDNTVTTFERDIPLSSITQEMQLDVAQARMGVFEVLGDDEAIDVEEDVFGNLDHAITHCRSLMVGGQSAAGPIEPLSNPADLASATILCRDLQTYQGMVRTLLSNPEANGEGTQFDTDVDSLFQRCVARTDELSASLTASVGHDARQLGLVGRALALVVLLTGVAIALLARRHRRVVAGQTAQLARFGSLVRSSGDAIISLTTLGEVLSWNPGAATLYGFTAEEIVGENAAILTAPRATEDFIDVWMPVSRGERTATIETIGVRHDGSEVPIALTLSPIVEGGVVTGVSAISRDISERRRKDEELAAARNEALEGSRLKSEFLATMSHEIRTPLNGVIGLNALLLETPLDETQRQYAEGVEGAGRTLMSVINDILDFSKLEADKVEFEISPFDPRAMLDEVAGLVAVAAHVKGLELLAYCSPELPTGLAGDSGRISQILLNLAGNAVKFTSSGEVVMRAFLLENDGQRALVRFEVRDTGIGLADAGRHRLFESFSQADASTTRRYGGTGLGLAICQRLVDGMGGHIGVDSELGQGSTFWFSLPLDLAPDGPAAPADPTPELLPGLRVLVVDDNATNRLILIQQLLSWRMVPEAVEDAASALVRLRSAAAEGQPFDIAILDLLMPDMDGLQLAQHKSADRDLDHTRMIMLTSTAHVESAALASAGIAQWCTKPVRTSVLYDRLMQLMTVGRPTKATRKPTTGGPAVLAGSRGRILVAEDNELNQLVAEGLVGRLGFDVEIVANGVEALEALARTSYSAVMMDCHMPVMDGFEATRRIRAAETGGPRTPIIAMTAGALDEDRKRCLEAGMDDFVTKPVDLAALERALVRWAVERV